MPSSSMASTVTARGGSSSGSPARAARYAVRPACLRALKAGGRWSNVPTKVCEGVAIAVVVRQRRRRRLIGPSASSVRERSPRRMTAS